MAEATSIKIHCIILLTCITCINFAAGLSHSRTWWSEMIGDVLSPRLNDWMQQLSWLWAEYLNLNLELNEIVSISYTCIWLFFFFSCRLFPQLYMKMAMNWVSLSTLHCEGIKIHLLEKEWAPAGTFSVHTQREENPVSVNTQVKKAWVSLDEYFTHNDINVAECFRLDK